MLCSSEPKSPESPGIKTQGDAAMILGFDASTWNNTNLRKQFGEHSALEHDDEPLLGSDVEDYKAEIMNTKIEIKHEDVSDLAREDGFMSPEPEYDDSDIQGLDPVMFVRAPT